MAPDQSARVLTFVPSQPECFGSPPWIAAFLRLTDAGFDVETALELAAHNYDVEIVDLWAFITGGAA